MATRDNSRILVVAIDAMVVLFNRQILQMSSVLVRLSSYQLNGIVASNGNVQGQNFRILFEGNTR